VGEDLKISRFIETLVIVCWFIYTISLCHNGCQMCAHFAVLA